jgi:hypothetical protein
MKLITDIAAIRELAEKRAEENWQFRCKLLISSVLPRRIDEAVQRIYQRISGKIDCTRCGNCCREISPLIDTRDIDRFAKALGISPEVFEENYCKYDDSVPGMVFKQTPCPFQTGNLCSIYQHRAHDCRAYPHLDQKHFTSRTVTVFSNCATCPIVFNLYEELKKEFAEELRDVPYEWQE